MNILANTVFTFFIILSCYEECSTRPLYIPNPFVDLKLPAHLLDGVNDKGTSPQSAEDKPTHNDCTCKPDNDDNIPSDVNSPFIFVAETYEEETTTHLRRPRKQRNVRHQRRHSKRNKAKNDHKMRRGQKSNKHKPTVDPFFGNGMISKLLRKYL